MSLNLIYLEHLEHSEWRATVAAEESLFSRLAESVGPMAKLPNNGASYHTGEQVITHLNRVLGPDHWSFRIIELGEEPDSDECWAFGELTAIMDGQVVVKQDYGSQAFKRSRSTGKYVAKWDDKKAAATDALKRCARLLGVGLDAWANERAPSWHPDEDASRPLGVAAAGKAAPTTPDANDAAPSTPATTATTADQPETVQARWAQLVKEAEDAKLSTLANVKAIDPKVVSAAQLKSYADRLENRLREVKGAA